MPRLDQYLFQKKWARSRSHARQLIENSQVELLEANQWKVITKPSFFIDEGLVAKGNIRVSQGEMNRYVSRAGLKLEGVLREIELSVEGYRVLDIGISTGGFADCILQRGAKSVVGVDVGHGQLASQLRDDSRIRLYEGINARDLTRSQFAEKESTGGFDLLLIDVSFISLNLILDDILPWVKTEGEVISLVKPQFEVGREHLDKKGLVKEGYPYLELEEEVKQWFSRRGISVKSYMESSIRGGDGNREFFVYGYKEY